MNDLGLTLAWVAVQVAILLAAAFVVHTFASRRGPAAGAWVAALSLGLVVVLNFAALVPGIQREVDAKVSSSAPAMIGHDHGSTSGDSPASRGVGVRKPAGGRSQRFVWLKIAWDRLGRGAAEPAARVRPWGITLAVVAMVGMAIGSLRLAIGLWAVALCWRRGRPIDDPGMTSLLEELKSAMGCRRPVAMREAPDLTTPATAGRRHPVILLPDDWRSWSTAERRAVVAHELAHIIRGDYAAGLLARLAVALNFYHPLVRFMAGRLQLQQEQAADAMGARFAGGRAHYMVALSSLALRQDGRPRSWPARAFLPARGALIRRITMLRDESQGWTFDQALSKPRRMVTVFGLLGLAIGVATLRGPVRGDEDRPLPSANAAGDARKPDSASSSFVLPFFREGTDGALVVRPAAAFQNKRMDPFLAMCRRELGENLSLIAKEFKVDTNQPGFLTIRGQDIEWFTTSISFDRSPTPRQNEKIRSSGGKPPEPMHRFALGSLAIRMVGPFDWLAFCRQWRFPCEEARVNGHTYYKITGEFKSLLGPKPCLLLPDDRTVVFDEEDAIRTITGREGPAPPPFAQGKEWERACQGLVAIAITNRNDSFFKHYDLGRPDDALVLSLLKGLDTWIVGVDDGDEIVVHADGNCRDRDAAVAISRSLESLIKLGRQFMEHDATDPPPTGVYEQVVRMLKAMAANVRIEHTDNAVTVRTRAFGTLADFAAIVDGLNRESTTRAAARNDAKKSVTK